jgi:hypothetical protein
MTPKQKAIEQLIRVGWRMSNLCCNLRQNEVRVPLQDDRCSMEQLFKEWDEALAHYRNLCGVRKKKNQRGPAISSALNEQSTT